MARPFETEHEKEKRYQRQILVPEIGNEGQKALSQKRVLVVGAGGLGTPCISYLCGMGIGHITILDPDVVSLSNLPRQIMYNPDDIGKPKAIVMAHKLSRANPNVSFAPLVEELSSDNAMKTLQGHDAVASCLDNLEARYILNQAAVTTGVPVAEGAVEGFQGICTVIYPGKGPCYRCIFPRQPNLKSGPSGVVGPAAGVIGSIQAIEIQKLLLKKGEPLLGRLLLVDLLTLTFHTISVEKDPNCPVCGKVHGDSPSPEDRKSRERPKT